MPTSFPIHLSLQSRDLVQLWSIIFRAGLHYLKGLLLFCSEYDTSLKNCSITDPFMHGNIWKSASSFTIKIIGKSIIKIFFNKGELTIRKPKYSFTLLLNRNIDYRNVYFTQENTVQSVPASLYFPHGWSIILNSPTFLWGIKLIAFSRFLVFYWKRLPWKYLYY